MNRLFGESHWDLNELTINYRNPQEVSELASRFAEEEGLYISTVNAVLHHPRFGVPQCGARHVVLAGNGRPSRRRSLPNNSFRQTAPGRIGRHLS